MKMFIQREKWNFVRQTHLGNENIHQWDSKEITGSS